jgi:hypothetical protein
MNPQRKHQSRKPVKKQGDGDGASGSKQGDGDGGSKKGDGDGGSKQDLMHEG